MSEHSKNYLEVPEARECAEDLYVRMIAEETARREAKQPPLRSLDVIRNQIVVENPDKDVVLNRTVRKYKMLAALAGAGFESKDEAPDELLVSIRANQFRFAHDIQGIESSGESAVELVGYGMYALPREKYIEILAHHYEVIGKLSIAEFQRGE